MIPEIRGEDCDPFRVIRGIFPSMSILLYVIFLITLILHLAITKHRITFENKENPKNLIKPILKNILFIFVFLKKYLYYYCSKAFS